MERFEFFVDKKRQRIYVKTMKQIAPSNRQYLIANTFRFPIAQNKQFQVI